MDKNRIPSMRRRTSRRVTAKSRSSNDADCKSGSYGLQAVELTSGDLPSIRDSGLKEK